MDGKMNLESDTIGEDEEIRMARETLPEPSRTPAHSMTIMVAPMITPILDMPVSGVECDPGFVDIRRIEFIKVRHYIGDTSFDAWASGVDGKVYL